jgi:hypothetical protein
MKYTMSLKVKTVVIMFGLEVFQFAIAVSVSSTYKLILFTYTTFKNRNKLAVHIIKHKLQ